MNKPLWPSTFHASQGVEDWRVVSEGACVFYRTATFEEAARLVAEVGELPRVEEHPPGVDVRRDGVTFRLKTATARFYGITERDLELARAISGVARRMGLAADPGRIQSILVIPGATDPAAVMPFWEAVLGYERRADSPDDDLVDPRRRGPDFWFEPMEKPRADGGGTVHVSAWVPYDQCQSRIEAAVAAGGRLVSDEAAPRWWTLADPAGNEVCVATSPGPG